MIGSKTIAKLNKASSLTTTQNISKNTSAIKPSFQKTSVPTSPKRMNFLIQ